MKRLLSLLACSACVALIGSGASAAQTRKAEDVAPLQSQQQIKGGIVTLYNLDPLARTVCFRDGREGLTIQNYRWRNRCSDLNFSLAGGGSFVAGIEGGRTAAIIDLGTAKDLRDRYGYEDSDDGGTGFASLRLQGEKILLLKEDKPREVLQPLKEGEVLFKQVGPSANAPIKLGHIYLVRTTDSTDASYQQIVKLIVIAYKPNESVTIRWEPL